MFAGLRLCPDCIYAFPAPEIQINAVSDNAAMLSTPKIFETVEIGEVHYFLHQKQGKKPCLRVEYMNNTYSQQYREWIHFEIMGNPRIRAASWWRVRTDLQLPNDTATALELARRLKKPSSIIVNTGKKYPEIVSYDFSGSQQDEVLLHWDNPSESHEMEIQERLF